MSHIPRSSYEVIDDDSPPIQQDSNHRKAKSKRISIKTMAGVIAAIIFFFMFVNMTIKVIRMQNRIERLQFTSKRLVDGLK